jgi:taurine dioxygenase
MEQTLAYTSLASLCRVPVRSLTNSAANRTISRRSPTMRIRPLRTSCGAEVTSFDLRGLTQAGRRRLRRALDDHLLLIFRDQQLSHDGQVTLTTIFGDVDGRILPRDLPFRHQEDRRIHVVSSTGSPAVTRSTVFWHTDQSYKPDPSPVVVLKAVVVPSPCSDTVFADMRAAYEALPVRKRTGVSRLAARHCFGALLGAASVTAPRNLATIHPLVRRHPVTKRRSLYLNQFSIDRIVGMPRRKSAEVLSSLYEHALKPEFIYSHAWQRGDVLVWDNLSLMHRAAEISATTRVLHRTHTREQATPGRV